jgi:hydrophobic/amphiphilic exporter-1 (mainly G- bacteria), HAE1 family
LIRFFADHPTAANLLMVAFLVIGMIAWPTLQRETFPRVEPNKVEVRVIYPSARPEDVEEAVCQRIEDAIDGVTNVFEVICEANEGTGKAVIEMAEGADFDRFTNDIKTEVEAINDFPDTAEPPTVRQLGRTDFVASVAVTGPATKTDLKAYAEEVKARMLRWGGIPKVDIRGFSDHQVRIELADATLRQYGISVADIAATIQRQSVDLPSGSIETSARELLIRFADERKKVADFRDLVVVYSAGGGQVRLGDIASISDRFDLDEEKTVFNGKPAAILDITKTESEDTLKVIDAVNGFLERERQTAPKAVSLQITRDISSIVRDRLQLLLRNGGQGLLLVLATLWIFFGFRYSFWVAMGLPVSFLGAIAMMSVIGYTINMLTMVGLLIVIGLLMDDAIVISENIASHRAKGKSPLESAIDGVKQVMPSVFASFVTTACIFGSLAFLKGDIGNILRVVPVVMLLVLMVSLVEAFIILPRHLNHALAHGAEKHGPVQRAMDGFISRVIDKIIGPVAVLAVQWRYLTVGIALASLLLTFSAIAGGLLKFSAFPDLDGDVMEARILLPQGTPLARTERVVEQLDAALGRVSDQLSPAQPDGQSLIKNITYKFNQNTDAYETGPHVATIVADLLESETRTVKIDDVLGQWRKETGDLADVVFVKFTEPSVGPGGLDIEIRLEGDDLAQLQAASAELKAWLTRYRGVINLIDDLRPGKPEVRLRLKDGAATLGIDGRGIADQLRSAFHGTTISEIQRGKESYEIDVRLAPRDRDSMADLDDFTITSAEGKQVPLSAVAEWSLGRGYSRINRINGRRTVTVQGDIEPGQANAGEILADTRANFFPDLLKRYRGVNLSLQGSEREADTTRASMIRGFLLGLIGIFLLLSFQFRSYVEPFVVMVIIPFSFIGAVAGHLLMGLDFTMPSILGFAALAGVVVNNSILLVNFIKHFHGEAASVADAAPMAVQARFRAILMTSLTTIVGLLPILSETSLQAQVLIPLVTSLAFGLLAATVLVLFLVPAAYAILDDMGLARLD